MLEYLTLLIIPSINLQLLIIYIRASFNFQLFSILMLEWDSIKFIISVINLINKNFKFDITHALHQKPFPLLSFILHWSLKPEFICYILSSLREVSCYLSSFNSPSVHQYDIRISRHFPLYITPVVAANGRRGLASGQLWL